MPVTNSPLVSSEILIVEDELMLRKRLVARLESEGAEVTVAGNVEEARNCLDSMDFDFAMVDVHFQTDWELIYLGIDPFRKILQL